MANGHERPPPQRRDEGIALLLLVLIFAIVAGLGVLVVSFLR